jgi:hypothetical protein
MNEARVRLLVRRPEQRIEKSEEASRLAHPPIRTMPARGSFSALQQIGPRSRFQPHENYPTRPVIRGMNPG